MTTIENFKCVFCNEVYDDKELLQEHFRKHGDPDFNKSAKNKGKSQNEVPSSTDKTEESEHVGCDVCEEVFPTISKAITHKHKVHPDHDAKYFCPWCGKLFTMKHLYNKHLVSSHNNETNVDVKDFHCDSCSVYFFIPSAMLHHNKFYHRQDIDLNSLGSSKKVKLFDQELVAILYCPFCGEEYNNKVNLHKHMEDDHGDENHSPEDVLRCPLCEAFFHHLDAYELHLTFHSAEDLYNEPNEMVSEITEFSLEAVPPLMEKVEDANLESVANFLELLEGEPSETSRVKSKKHKKHKKSKKESITLDEFLNMNKDVFGDGLNVQGIEEVPTQMVLKRKYKTKKPSNNVDAKTVKQDLAKLKKHGIVIKKKTSNIPPDLVQNLKNNKIPQTLQDPNDVISKLISHGNSQIKISKKSVQKDTENKQESYQSNKIDSSSDYDTNQISQTYLDEKRDLIQNEEEQLNNPVTEETFKEKINPPHNIDEDSDISPNRIENNEDAVKYRDDCLFKEAENATVKTISEESPLKTLQKIGTALTIKSVSQRHEMKDDDNIDTNKAENGIVKNIPEESPFKTKQNTCAALAIKSVSQTNSKIKDVYNDDRDCVNNEDNNEQSFEDDPNDEDKEAMDLEEKNIKNNTLQSLNLNMDITVKSVVKNNISATSPHRENQDISEKSPLQNKSIDALKGLSKHITVKPSRSSPSSNIHHSSDEGEKSDIDDENKNKNQSNQKSLPKKTVTQTRLEHTETGNSEFVQSHADILKRLTNVTAKPVPPKILQIDKTLKTIPKKESIKSTLENEVEILHIDDSDSDADADHIMKYKQNFTKPSQSPVGNKSQLVKTKPSAALRGLSKNITVKSMSQQSMKYTESLSKDGHKECKKTSVSRTFESKNVSTIKNNDKLLEEQKNLQKTINHLRRHITIKPKTNPQLNYREESLQDDEDIDNMEQAFEDEDYNSDTSVGNIKITELNEDEMSDAEHQTGLDKMDDERNIKVESPQDFNTDTDLKHDDVDHDFDDIETQIKANPIKISKQTKHPAQLPKPSNLGNLNKELTIKPVRQKQLSEDEMEEFCDNSRNVKTVAVRLANQKQQVNKNVQSNQKASSSTNKVNTVKTVKTYQSKTVIEEVTTTVTKTIRTVNTHEVKNASQIVSRPIRPQKIMNKTTNPVRGTPIRQTLPSIGTKVRHATPQASPSASKPTNLIIPARPRFNTPQMPRPCRKPTAMVQQRPPASFTPNKPVKTTPPDFKTGKRQSKETGPFSCFKKPKESLIPVQDIPGMKDEDRLVQYSSSQNKSTFSNVTKVMQGNSSSTPQVRSSETSMSSEQQFAKLSGVSGLKIVKTSYKQATQVEEKCEVSAPKNNTIAALEKLQKQGLLIKKPRLDSYVNENHSQSGNEENNEEEYQE